jgi:plastocyanin
MGKSFAQSALAGALRAAAFVIALIATAPAWAADMVVRIDNFAFYPQRLTVKSGTTVVWENADGIPHTIASSTKIFRSKALDTGDEFSFTFMTPGTYEYFCSLHPHMTGTIVVEAATGSATPQ